ncbi:MAG: UDP-N-acetylmuramate--L-alanine ligase [Planctomycetes bacterium]|nr:UDP-N-acetylmuramate--L-alanine ligase [Planctomycetota bacterium]
MKRRPCGRIRIEWNRCSLLPRVPAPTVQSLRGRSMAWFHFVGIGGVGMSGAARILLARGIEVSGSDLGRSEATEELALKGARVFQGHRAENVPEQATRLVVTAAVDDANPEVQEARRRGIPMVRYATLLGELMRDRFGIAVAGCHGKSTTSAMTAFLLDRGGYEPSFVVGGGIPDLGGNSRAGKGEPFVAEACEHFRSFHNLYPHIAVVTNIEEDHLDYYRDIDEIVGSFGVFLSHVPPEGLVVINGEDADCARAVRAARCRVETFGTGPGMTWRAANVRVEDGRWRFDALRHEALFGRFELSIPGAHNVMNALAAIAVAASLEMPAEAIASALPEFHGVQRRMEWLVRGPVSVMDDYAHHPTEIRATLAALRALHPDRRIVAVFQPHQYSRTRIMLDGFAHSFADADEVVIPGIFAARDSEEDRRAVSAWDLADDIRATGTPARVFDSFDEAVLALRSVAAPAVVLTMGAGDVWKIAGALSLLVPQTGFPRVAV